MRSETFLIGVFTLFYYLHPHVTKVGFRCGGKTKLYKICSRRLHCLCLWRAAWENCSTTRDPQFLVLIGFVKFVFFSFFSFPFFVFVRHSESSHQDRGRGRGNGVVLRTSLLSLRTSSPSLFPEQNFPGFPNCQTNK